MVAGHIGWPALVHGPGSVNEADNDGGGGIV